MAMNNAQKRHECIIVAFIAVFIACCFALIRHFSGIWAPIDSVDIAAYWSGVQLFLTDKNPYDSQIIILKQQELGSYRTDLMVWNPPILFAMLSPFYSIPLYWARLIWTTLTTVFNIFGAYFSWKIATVRSALKFPTWLFFALFFCPYLYEMAVEQISSFLGLLLIISIFLYKRGHYGFAGAAAGLLIVKPHVVFLVIGWYFLVSALTKRWIFYFGFFSSIALGSIFAEVLQPGITLDWLTRETWPTQIVGTTLPSLMKAAVFSYYNTYTHIPQILIPSIAVFAVVLAIWRDYRKGNYSNSLILSIVLCPLCAPYGFVFDQAMLIVPIIILTVHAYDPDSSKGRRRIILLGLVAAQLLVLLTAGTRIFGITLGWYLLPPLILLFWILLGRPTLAESQGQS